MYRFLVTLVPFLPLLPHQEIKVGYILHKSLSKKSTLLSAYVNTEIKISNKRVVRMAENLGSENNKTGDALKLACNFPRFLVNREPQADCGG